MRRIVVSVLHPRPVIVIEVTTEESHRKLRTMQYAVLLTTTSTRIYLRRFIQFISDKHRFRARHKKQEGQHPPPLDPARHVCPALLAVQEMGADIDMLRCTYWMKCIDTMPVTKMHDNKSLALCSLMDE